MPLTQKQKKFADYFIETDNATQAAIKAGYSKKTAKQIGSNNLTKVDVSAYIKARLDEMDKERVASADEVMKFYTSVMRGEVKDQFGLDAQLTDRISAAKELMKRFAAVDDRKKDALERLDALLGEFKNAVDE